MGKKGTDRHARRFQATQQASSKFKQKATKYGWWGLEIEEADPNAIRKLINKVVK